jgi:broad specificity phosphatase PhoE
MTMSRIFLVRHGQTEWNLAGRYQGALDSPLTEQGTRQAHRIGKALARHAEGLEAAHVSPLGRTRQTYRILASYLGQLPVHHDDRLREVSTGSWDGLMLEDREAGWPSLLESSTRFDWYFRSPDGESYQAALDRVQGWLADVEGTAVAVSHGLLGRLIRGAYLGLPRAEALSLPVDQDAIWVLADGRVSRMDTEL